MNLVVVVDFAKVAASLDKLLIVVINRCTNACVAILELSESLGSETAPYVSGLLESDKWEDKHKQTCSPKRLTEYPELELLDAESKNRISECLFLIDAKRSISGKPHK